MSLFISYRRSDAPAEARAIYDFLVGIYGADKVFKDVDSIKKGSDFRRVLDVTLNACSVLLVIIGPNWLLAASESGEHRLQDPTDFVRMELCTALSRRIVVIPILVNGAKMPTSTDLPTELSPLSSRQAISLRAGQLSDDMGLIDNAVAPHVSWEILDRRTLVAATGVGMLTVSIAVFISSPWSQFL